LAEGAPVLDAYSARLLRRVGICEVDPHRLRSLAPIADYVRRQRTLTNKLRQRSFDDVQEVLSDLALSSSEPGFVRHRMERLEGWSIIRRWVTNGETDFSATTWCNLASVAWPADLKIENELERAASDLYAIGDVARANYAALALAGLHRLRGRIAAARELANRVLGTGGHAEVAATADYLLASTELDPTTRSSVMYRHIAERLPLATPHEELGLRIANGLIAASHDDPQEAARQYRSALQIARSIGDRAGEAAALSGLADQQRGRNNIKSVEDLYRRILAIYREIGDREGEAGVLASLGDLVRKDGDVPTAQAYLTNGLVIARDIGARTRIANILLISGHIFRDASNYSTAEIQYSEALRIYEHLGDGHGLCSVRIALGNLYTREGRISEAHDAYDRGIELAKRLDKRSALAHAERGLGVLYGSSPDSLDESSKHFRQAVALYHELGEMADWARTAVRLAEVDVRRGGAYGASVRLVKEAISAFRTLGMESAEGWAHLDLAHIAYRERQAADATQNYERAIEIGVSIPDPVLTGSAAHGLGNVSSTFRDYKQAEKRYQQAWKALDGRGVPQFEGHALMGLGRVAVHTGRPGQYYFEKALRCYQICSDSKGEAEALAALRGEI
jgi:tetratricopeptide (TPR) repeat protein